MLNSRVSRGETTKFQLLSTELQPTFNVSTFITNCPYLTGLSIPSSSKYSSTPPFPTHSATLIVANSPCASANSSAWRHCLWANNYETSQDRISQDWSPYSTQYSMRNKVRHRLGVGSVSSGQLLMSITVCRTKDR